jgi:hypothetical protein
MMRERTDGLRNIAHCNMPFWMVPLNVNLYGLRVNYFFWDFPLRNRYWNLRGKQEINFFLFSYLKGRKRNEDLDPRSSVVTRNCCCPRSEGQSGLFFMDRRKNFHDLGRWAGIFTQDPFPGISSVA